MLGFGNDLSVIFLTIPVAFYVIIISTGTEHNLNLISTFPAALYGNKFGKLKAYAELFWVKCFLSLIRRDNTFEYNFIVK